MEEQIKKTKIEAMKRNSAKAEDMLKLLANSNRLMILCHLVRGKQSVSQLLDNIDISQSSLSQHLAKMKEQGLVGSEKNGKMVYYYITSQEAEAILSTLYLIYCKE